MTEIARDHHSTPQRYLRQWSSDKNKVWAYRTLVPSEGYPTWELRSIRSLTSYEDLYSSALATDSSDSFEKWLNTEVEGPAAEALDRVSSGNEMRKAHWDALAVFVAAQDLRTPAAYVEALQRYERVLPEVLEETLKGAVRKLADPGFCVPVAKPPAVRAAGESIPMRVVIEDAADGKGKQLRAEVTAGREMWLYTMRQAITKTSRVLRSHKWVVLRPHATSNWFTSDHPVVRLNYYGPESYDFKGGWGRKNAEILFPLSPDALMYTKVGDRQLKSQTLSPEMTGMFQRFIAERAHRWIIATAKVQRAEWFRPRRVDRDGHREEEDAWSRWDEMQRSGLPRHEQNHDG